MTIKNLCFLFIRLLSLFYFLQFLQSLLSLPYIFMNEIGSYEIIVTTLLTLAPLLISLVLFFSAKLITEFILKSEYLDKETNASLSFAQLSAVVFAGIGMYIFVDSFIYTIGRIESYFLIKDSLGGYTDGNEQIKSIKISILISSFKVAISFFLIIGSKKIAEWWIKFKNWT